MSASDIIKKNSALLDKTNKPLETPPLAFFINSDKRLPGSISVSDFDYRIDMPPDNTFTRCIVKYVCIPKTFYNVSKPYNTFVLTEGIHSVEIEIPEASYNRKSLAVTLTDLLNAHRPSNFSYEISYSGRNEPDTGKYTFTVSNNGGIQPIFIFPSNQSIYEQLGFNFNSNNVFKNDQLTSTNVIYIHTERTLFINSNLIVNPNNLILQELYVPTIEPFSTITFTQNEYYYNAKTFTRQNSNVYNFRLTDENDVPINLNGLAWNITILFF